MKEKIFRQKSLERVSSPDQLNDYIKVSTPGMWRLLAAVIIFLVGVCVWCVTARLESHINAVCISDGHTAQLVVKEDDKDEIDMGMVATIEGVDYVIATIPNQAVQVDDYINEYAQYKGKVQEGEWVFLVALEDAPEAGTYTAKVVVESIPPIKFIFN